MKNLYILVLILLPFSSLFAQTQSTSALTTHDLQDSIIVLNKRFTAEINTVFREFTVTDSLKYKSGLDSISLTLQNAKFLSINYDNTVNEQQLTSLVLNLGEALNPQDSILGFSFDSIIVRSARNRFKDIITQPEDKKRFGSILNSILNNQVVNKLVNSNPISSIASQVVTAVIGFTSKSGGNLANPVAQDANGVQIKAFIGDLQPYMDFYSQISKAYNNYNVETKEFETKYIVLKTSSHNYFTSLLTALNIDSFGILSTNLDVVLPQPKEIPVDKNIDKYISYLNKPEFIKGLKIAGQYGILNSEINDFTNGYNDILSDYFKSYLVALNYLNTDKQFTFDKSKVTTLILTIEAWINNHKKQGESDVTITAQSKTKSTEGGKKSSNPFENTNVNVPKINIFK